MTTLKYIGGGEEANWVEHLYHTSVEVIGGIVETNDPLVADALWFRDFRVVEEESQPEAPKSTTRKKAS